MDVVDDEDDELERTVNVAKRVHDARAALRVIVLADDKASTHPLPAIGEITIGRFTGSKLVVNHHTLSRMHAVLRLTPEDMTIEDLGSENGTFVRETRITPGKQVSISAGDVVRLGDVILIFRL